MRDALNYWLYIGVIQESLPALLEDADNMLSGRIASAARTAAVGDMQYLGRQIDGSGKLILQIAKEIDSCQRLIAVPGIWPLTATATIAAIVTDRLSRMAADLNAG